MSAPPSVLQLKNMSVELIHQQHTHASIPHILCLTSHTQRQRHVTCLSCLHTLCTPMHDTTIDVTFFPARKPREQDSMRDRTRNEGRCYRRYPTNQIKKETDAWMMELAPSVVLWGQTTFMFSVQSVH